MVDPPPPITDDRPLGERDDVVIDVVRVRFSEAEVEAVRDRMWRSIPREDWSSFGLDGTGYGIKLQRVNLYLVNPPEGAVGRHQHRFRSGHFRGSVGGRFRVRGHRTARRSVDLHRGGVRASL